MAIPQTTEELNNLLEANLKKHLHILKSGEESFYEVMEYALLPAGKLFRPKLCLSQYADKLGWEETLKDLKNPMSALSLCCSALEIHHTYTLIHDDLPCMDDDDIRRGRPSTHIKFSEWEAVLAGDALLHLSHTLLAKIKSPKLNQPLSFFNWALGGRGLILGQVYDLSGKMNKNFENLVTTHTLKTARLIQAALYLGDWCSGTKSNYLSVKKNLRLGEALGVSFQLLDDLSEGTEDLSEHEASINPFINFPSESFQILTDHLHTLNKSVSKKENPFLQQTLEIYFHKMRSLILKDLQKENSLIQANFKLLENQTHGWEQLISGLDKNLN
ncbi:MAG: polyprenyl synthetase family protein [Halobacteriovoraceae bacterium]|nr:polyprenyl synthetase family protein [Halobacteriovoraceae bacterium]